MDPKKKLVFVEPGTAASFELKGIRIDQLLSREACDRFSAYLVRMEPGQVKKASYHKEGEELYYILSGTGRAELGEESHALRPGCFFRVPPGTIHTFVAQDEALVMLNFHSPPVFRDHDTFFPEDQS